MKNRMYAKKAFFIIAAALAVILIDSYIVEGGCFEYYCKQTNPPGSVCSGDESRRDDIVPNSYYFGEVSSWMSDKVCPIGYTIGVTCQEECTNPTGFFGERYCSGGNLIKCSGVTMKWETIKCPYGCSIGMCCADVHCCPSGQEWDDIEEACVDKEVYEPTPPPASECSPECSSGQYCSDDGNCCDKGYYWGGSSCINANIAECSCDVSTDKIEEYAQTKTLDAPEGGGTRIISKLRKFFYTISGGNKLERNIQCINKDTKKVCLPYNGYGYNGEIKAWQSYTVYE